jgi:hypothetical protein
MPGGPAEIERDWWLEDSIMTELLFDIAWWVPVLVVAAGVGLLVMGNNRQQAMTRNAGVVVALLGIAWLVLSFVMDTPSKICQKQTKQIAQAIADDDWKTFEDLTDAKVAFKFVGRPWRADGRAALEPAVQETVKHAGLHSASVAHAKATRDGDKITVSFVCYTDTELTPGHPIDSDWEFDWRLVGDQWKLIEMRVSRVDDTAPEGIRESLNKR